MCEEVFELVRKMDLSNVEIRLALQCAPVITGIKISNLLIISGKDEAQIARILNGTGISYYRLFQEKEKTVSILYRWSELVKYLQNHKVQYHLARYGYVNLSFDEILRKFQKQYALYMKYGGEFPHELGLFLGYPVEDVEGFIKNKGKNYLYAGYWKVYAAVEEKKLLFHAYESAKEGLLLLLGNGYSIRPVLEYFRDNGYEVFYAKECENALEHKALIRYIYQRE